MAHGTLAIGASDTYGTPSARVNLLSTLIGRYSGGWTPGFGYNLGGRGFDPAWASLDLKSLLATTISLEIAAAEGQSPQRARRLFMPFHK